MLDQALVRIIESSNGFASIFAGSDSDREHIEQITTALEFFDIPHIVHICSAHKQCEELMSVIHAYNQIVAPIALIAVAGGTDALSGILSYHAYAPVISCPPDSPNTSCLHNPKGSSNAYMWKPYNLARFVAQSFSHLNPNIRSILDREKAAKIQKLQQAHQDWVTSSLFNLTNRD